MADRRRHRFTGKSIDVPDNLSEAQLDGRACIHCGPEPAIGEAMRPVEAWSELSSQLFECVDARAARTDRSHAPMPDTRESAADSFRKATTALHRSMARLVACLAGTTPVREPWYPQEPNPTGPRLCGFCYADRVHRGVFERSCAVTGAGVQPARTSRGSVSTPASCSSRTADASPRRSVSKTA